MTLFVLGTNSVHHSAAIADYLAGRVGPDDEVHAINSQVGGDDTDAKQARDGEDALNAIESRLGELTTVETHQFIRGNKPEEDVLGYADEVDADEVVIGVRKRNPTSKVVFGSTAQKILLRSNRPMAVVPLEDV